MCMLQYNALYAISHQIQSKWKKKKKILIIEKAYLPVICFLFISSSLAARAAYYEPTLCSEQKQSVEKTSLHRHGAVSG